VENVEMMHTQETVHELLARIASPGPAGGGGAAAALAGALAAALVEMVAGVAARRAPDDARLREIVAEAGTLRARVLGLIERDVEAFGRVVEARRRTDAARAADVCDALIGATEVPLELATASALILEQCASVLPAARPSTLADIGVAATLAVAALESAAITARANLDALAAAPAGSASPPCFDLEPSMFVADCRRRLQELREAGAALRARLPRAAEVEP
jgi:glutamate formiminotransferase/formiminotetrahydrofolate cyclodeaminase